MAAGSSSSSSKAVVVFTTWDKKDVVRLPLRRTTEVCWGELIAACVAAVPAFDPTAHSFNIRGNIVGNYQYINYKRPKNWADDNSQTLYHVVDWTQVTTSVPELCIVVSLDDRDQTLAREEWTSFATELKAASAAGLSILRCGFHYPRGTIRPFTRDESEREEVSHIYASIPRLLEKVGSTTGSGRRGATGTCSVARPAQTPTLAPLDAAMSFHTSPSDAVTCIRETWKACLRVQVCRQKRTFTAVNSYERRLIHLIAEFMGLSHKTLDHTGAACPGIPDAPKFDRTMHWDWSTWFNRKVKRPPKSICVWFDKTERLKRVGLFFPESYLPDLVRIMGEYMVVDVTHGGAQEQEQDAHEQQPTASVIDSTHIGASAAVTVAVAAATAAAATNATIGSTM